MKPIFFHTVHQKILLGLLMSSALLFSNQTMAQQIPAGLSDTLFSTYYQQRVSLFRLLPKAPGQIVFLGNSITDGAEWNELFPGTAPIINRGISGDMTAGVLNRLDEVTDRKPAKIFLLIGTNDLAHGLSTDSVLFNIFLIAKLIHKNSPLTRLYIQSIFPVNAYYHKFASHTGNMDKIRTINEALSAHADRLNYTYIDVFDELKGSDGLLDIHLTNDGLHQKGSGYMRWTHLIYPYVMDVSKQPALLPSPKSLRWRPGKFPLYKLHQITYQQDSLKDLAASFAQNTAGLHPEMIISKNIQPDQPSLIIRCEPQLQWPDFAGKPPTAAANEEAYSLQVTNEQILLKATTCHGIYNGLQTLKQLMRDGSFIDNCQISDYPSFSWRGYMIDVGRNFQPMALIKKQIDLMGELKLNIFHFHLTEDVAWRLAIKKYPQLTSARNMTRDPGLFYSEKDLKSLIQYCEDRFITFIPEIDMPGHSAAFKRAMGFDMQSDSGIIVMENILSEICATYNLPYFHIGADEVPIHNNKFLPAMIKLLEDHGKKVIGWDPGGTYPSTVYRQLWRGTTQALEPANYKRIDSRNLYINHMAPEESVISIYNHAIDDRQSGDSNNIGATLCLWNDRKLANPLENLTHNPTLASLLAFAERTWCGGGKTGNLIGLNHLTPFEKQQFEHFEDRMLSIQQTFYKNIPFQYIRQSNIQWQLLGPFDNKGDLTTVFAPETRQQGENPGKTNPGGSVTGGTIILRHFWDPVVKGLLDTPKANTTYYAKGYYWSPIDTTALLWVGFYDYSRSTATAPPKPGTWNELESIIWLNGKTINPPSWQRTDQNEDLEIPYIDENYYFRAPLKVSIKKGWNNLLLKMPVGTFKSDKWYAPVKWMFTAIFVQAQPGSSVNNMEQNRALYAVPPSQ